MRKGSVGWERIGAAAFVALLILPALSIVAGLAAGDPWRAAIRPSGDIAAKLLVLALAIAPLRVLLPRLPALFWLERRRRILGLGAFAYGVLHIIVFVASIGRLDWIVQGMAFASMWTGWLAFVLLATVAAVSSNRAMQVLGPWWKRVQRLAWPAAILTLAHWLLLAPPAEALLHFMPLAMLWLARAWTERRRLASPRAGARLDQRTRP
jgi:sulfoxide reductase heme-binding subunit YedZ